MPTGGTGSDADEPAPGGEFRTGRVLGPREPVTRDTYGWVATDGIRTFAIANGEDRWSEASDLIGYWFGERDDGGTIMRSTPLDPTLPPLPIGPNTDPDAPVGPPDTTRHRDFTHAVNAFFHGRGRLRRGE